MRNKIAEIRLAPGQVGFYDDLTNIHLTLTKPISAVYQGMNTSRLQQSVNSGRLLLTWGSLRPAPVNLNIEEPAPMAMKAKAVKEEVKPVEVIEETVEPVAAEEIVEPSIEIEEETIITTEEAVIQEAEVEVVEETKPKRKSTKK